MGDSEPKAAVGSVIPVREEVGERIPAVSQTGAAERCEVDNACPNQYDACGGGRQLSAAIQKIVVL